VKEFYVGPVSFCPAQALGSLDDDLARGRTLGEKVGGLVEVAVEGECGGVDLLLPGGRGGRRHEFDDTYISGRKSRPECFRVSMCVGFRGPVGGHGGLCGSSSGNGIVGLVESAVAEHCE
jgi:hypothetical protein